jgi:predicted enzyme related to lactoylglutathione lyase
MRIADRPDGRTPPARWIGLMSVPDVDAAIARVTATGGRLLAGPTAQFGRGTVALLADPDGAPFGVVRAIEGDPEDRAARDGEWIWRELWAADGARMAAWYRDLGHFALRRLVGPDDRDEWLLSSGDVPRAGVIDKPASVRHAAWLPYLRVADLEVSMRAVADAGGTVLAPPSPAWRAGRVAIVADPQGAAVGLALAPAEGAR